MKILTKQNVASVSRKQTKSKVQANKVNGTNPFVTQLTCRAINMWYNVRLSIKTVELMLHSIWKLLAAASNEQMRYLQKCGKSNSSRLNLQDIAVTKIFINNNI